MSDVPVSLEDVQEYLEDALEADPGEKDFYVRQVLQTSVILEESRDE